MIKLEPYKIQFMGDDCFLVCFSAHSGEHYTNKIGSELAENNHNVEFEIMVKRQDSIEALMLEAKKKAKEILSLLAT